MASTTTRSSGRDASVRRRSLGSSNSSNGNHHSNAHDEDDDDDDDSIAEANQSAEPPVPDRVSSQSTPRMITVSTNVDGDGTQRAQEVRLRRRSSCRAMSGRERMRMTLLRNDFFGWTAAAAAVGDHDRHDEEEGEGGGGGGYDDGGGDDDVRFGAHGGGDDGGSLVAIDEEHGPGGGGDGGGSTVRQFNLTATSVQRDKGGFLRCPRPIRGILHCIYLTCCCGSDYGFDASTSASTTSMGDSSRLLSRFINFLFRCSFLFVVLISAAGFYVLNCIFAGILVGAASLDPTCVSIGGDPGFPGGEGTQFADAFELSWTTFSTVGYGSYSPTVAQDSSGSTNHCAFITVICCIESFIGVLFGGFVGAIIFSKITRIQSLAQVEFSHPIVVRYGCGVAAWETEMDEDQDDDDDDRREAGHVTTT